MTPYFHKISLDHNDDEAWSNFRERLIIHNEPRESGKKRKRSKTKGIRYIELAKSQLSKQK